MDKLLVPMKVDTTVMLEDPAEAMASTGACVSPRRRGSGGMTGPQPWTEQADITFEDLPPWCLEGPTVTLVGEVDHHRAAPWPTRAELDAHRQATRVPSGSLLAL
ncbi:MAG: hypothetical protein ACR2MB_16780 [Acidimicrobiales bacterium]